MVTITSLVPKNARNNPGIAAAAAPAQAPAMIANGKTTNFGESGMLNATQILASQPQSACPDSPTLKNPAELATENPSAVKINGPAPTKISPIDILLWNAELNIAL